MLEDALAQLRQQLDRYEASSSVSVKVLNGLTRENRAQKETQQKPDSIIHRRRRRSSSLARPQEEIQQQHIQVCSSELGITHCTNYP